MNRIGNILKCKGFPSRTSLSFQEFEAQTAAESMRARMALATERREILRRQAEALFARSAMPPRFEKADLDGPMPSQIAEFEIGRAYAAGFGERLADGAGLVVHGSGTMDAPRDVGTGKSWLICAIGNALLAQGRSVLYCTAAESVQRIRQTFTSGNGTELGVISALCQPDLLLFDELGVQNDTVFERRVIEQVVDGRCRSCRPTLFATNLGPEAILGLVGERVYDRMRDGWFVPMCGASLRGRR